MQYMYPYFYFPHIVETMAWVQTSENNISLTLCCRWMGFNVTVPEFSILLYRFSILGFLLVEVEDTSFVLRSELWVCFIVLYMW